VVLLVAVTAYRKGLQAAGFVDVAVVDTGADLNAYSESADQPTACCGPTCCSTEADQKQTQLIELMKKYNINDYAISVKVYAVRPSNS
jgi:hypothetical protein